jgi:hypothetical protein
VFGVPPHALVSQGYPPTILGPSKFIPNVLSHEHPEEEAKTVKTASDKPTVIAL